MTKKFIRWDSWPDRYTEHWDSRVELEDFSLWDLVEWKHPSFRTAHQKNYNKIKKVAVGEGFEPPEP